MKFRRAFLVASLAASMSGLAEAGSAKADSTCAAGAQLQSSYKPYSGGFTTSGYINYLQHCLVEQYIPGNVSEQSPSDVFVRNSAQTRFSVEPNVLRAMSTNQSSARDPGALNVSAGGYTQGYVGFDDSFVFKASGSANGDYVWTTSLPFNWSVTGNSVNSGTGASYFGKVEAFLSISVTDTVANSSYGGGVNVVTYFGDSAGYYGRAPGTYYDGGSAVYWGGGKGPWDLLWYPDSIGLRVPLSNGSTVSVSMLLQFDDFLYGWGESTIDAFHTVYWGGSSATTAEGLPAVFEARSASGVDFAVSAVPEPPILVNLAVGILLLGWRLLRPKA